MCVYCELKETGNYAGSAFLWGRDLTGEFEGEFNVVKAKHDGKHYLKYEDEETDNTSEEPINFCPMCGRKFD